MLQSAILAKISVVVRVQVGLIDGSLPLLVTFMAADGGEEPIEGSAAVKADEDAGLLFDQG